MSFYLIAIVVALTTIFGLVHSQKARERLHLQTLYNWSVGTLQQQFEQYDLFGYQEPNDDLVETIEVAIDRTEEVPMLSEALPASESVEEINGIRIGSEENKQDQKGSLERASKVEPPTAAVLSNEQNEQSAATSSHITSSQRQQEEQQQQQQQQFPKYPSAEMRENVLAALNASLQKLSTVAGSGRINGTQLYEILLRETLLYDKARQQHQETEQNDGAPSEDAAPGSSATIVEVNEPTEEPDNRPRMYFGQSPMEYVPHQDPE